MLVLISMLLAGAAILWSVVYARFGVLETFKTILRMVFVDFFLVGFLVSTALWCVGT